MFICRFTNIFISLAQIKFTMTVEELFKSAGVDIEFSAEANKTVKVNKQESKRVHEFSLRVGLFGEEISMLESTVPADRPIGVYIEEEKNALMADAMKSIIALAKTATTLTRETEEAEVK